MDEAPGCQSVSYDRRRGRGIAKRAAAQEDLAAEEPGAAQPTAPCGACKFLRRKCVSGCIFAPYFGSDQGAARFAAVHKVFGASNVSKMLLHIPVNRRQDAVTTICYEAQARLADPVYGCVSTVLALQQQVGSLQAELALVQAQLANSRYAVANAYQNSETLPPPHPPQQQPLQQQQHYLRIPVLQPAYSNTSPATSTTNFINIEGLACANFDMNPVEAAASSHTHTLEPLHQFSHPSIQDDNEPEEEEEDEEEESQIRALFGEETLGRSRR